MKEISEYYKQVIKDKDGLIQSLKQELDAAQRPTVAPKQQDLIDKIECLNGYLKLYAEGKQMPNEVPQVVQECDEWLEQLTPEQATPVAPDYDCVCVRCNREGHAKEWHTVGLESHSGYGADPICDECYKELIGEESPISTEEPIAEDERQITLDTALKFTENDLRQAFYSGRFTENDGMDWVYDTFYDYLKYLNNHE